MIYTLESLQQLKVVQKVLSFLVVLREGFLCVAGSWTSMI